MGFKRIYNQIRLVQFMIRTKEMYKFGVGFWIGAGIYSLVNMVLNLRNVAQLKILNYNYIITGVAIIGLILNLVLLKRKKK